MDTVLDQDEACQRATLPVFFDSVQKNWDAEHRARSPLSTRVSICITEARVTMEIGMYVV